MTARAHLLHGLMQMPPSMHAFPHVQPQKPSILWLYAAWQSCTHRNAMLPLSAAANDRAELLGAAQEARRVYEQAALAVRAEVDATLDAPALLRAARDDCGRVRP